MGDLRPGLFCDHARPACCNLAAALHVSPHLAVLLVSAAGVQRGSKLALTGALLMHALHPHTHPHSSACVAAAAAECTSRATCSAHTVQRQHYLLRSDAPHIRWSMQSAMAATTAVAAQGRRWRRPHHMSAPLPPRGPTAGEHADMRTQWWVSGTWMLWCW